MHMFKTKRTRELEEQVATLTDLVANREAKIADLNVVIRQQDIELAEVTLQRDQLQESTESAEAMATKLTMRDVPTFMLTADDPDDTRGLKVTLDWNKSLVSYLSQFDKASSNDEALIQRWLITLCEGLIRDLEMDLIDQRSEIVGRDFE